MTGRRDCTAIVYEIVAWFCLIGLIAYPFLVLLGVIA